LPSEPPATWRSVVYHQPQHRWPRSCRPISPPRTAKRCATCRRTASDRTGAARRRPRDRAVERRRRAMRAPAWANEGSLRGAAALDRRREGPSVSRRGVELDSLWIVSLSGYCGNLDALSRPRHRRSGGREDGCRAAGIGSAVARRDARADAAPAHARGDGACAVDAWLCSRARSRMFATVWRQRCAGVPRRASSGFPIKPAQLHGCCQAGLTGVAGARLLARRASAAGAASDDWVQCFETLRRDPGFAQPLGSRAQRFVTFHTWDACFRRSRGSTTGSLASQAASSVVRC